MLREVLYKTILKLWFLGRLWIAVNVVGQVDNFLY